MAGDIVTRQKAGLNSIKEDRHSSLGLIKRATEDLPARRRQHFGRTYAVGGRV